MRLAEIERGDGADNRLLIRFISLVSGMRLPDAARVAFYHKEFASKQLGAWTQTVMRGPSHWSVGERELMAAMVAKWNACRFCLGAHAAVAATQIDRSIVDATLSDASTAPISVELRATLAFLQAVTLRPTEVTADQAKVVLQAGVTAQALADAIAVAALFNIITRYADTLDFRIPSAEEFERSAGMLLKRGYAG